MKKKYVICVHRENNVKFFRENASALTGDFHFITDKNDLTARRLAEIRPDYVFFVDWSWIVPAEIYTAYKCVVFHAAPLPQFRGGSPIQNQIVRGIKNTKLTAFFMSEGIDTGDILLQEDLNLEGHLREIFSRICALTLEMMRKIAAGEFTVRKQGDGGSVYKRRKPEESELRPEDVAGKPLSCLHDFIRMLEDPYPNAFLRVGKKKIIFKESELSADGGKLSVSAEIVEAEPDK